jgi:uncharacterized protein (TIGR02646 family)
MIFVEKSSDIPEVLECLAKEKAKGLKGNYRQAAVIQQLKDDFHGKCYLCEARAHDFHVEHFKPHRNKNLNLMFGWENLFLGCGYCNGIKLAQAEYDELLNCTIEATHVEEQIHCEIENWGTSKEFKVIVKATNDTPQAKATAKLLNSIFSGTTPLKKIGTENLLFHLKKDYTLFMKLIDKYLETGANVAEIKAELASDSEYTAFKRAFIRRDPQLSALLIY